MRYLALAVVAYVAGYLHGRYQARKVEDAAVSAVERFRLWMRRHGFDPAVIVLSLGLIACGLGWWLTSSRLGDIVDCNASYSKASLPRSDAAEDRDEKQTAFLQALASGTDGEKETTFVDLLAASEKLEKVRDDNPLPDCSG